MDSTADSHIFEVEVALWLTSTDITSSMRTPINVPEMVEKYIDDDVVNVDDDEVGAVVVVVVKGDTRRTLAGTATPFEAVPMAEELLVSMVVVSPSR